MINFVPRSAPLAALAFVAAACAGPSASRRPPPRADAPDLVVREARVAVAQGETLDGHHVPSECSGFVRALFLSSGIDLFAAAREGDTGVRAIARYVQRHGRWERGAVPRPGDIAFFDNSYDRDRDGRLDDALTHVGVVVDIEGDGTAVIAHATNHGIVREPMNLRRRHETTDGSGKRINAALRRRSPRDSPRTPHLLGELFAGFGRVLR
jgi:hypothetical protein